MTHAGGSALEQSAPDAAADAYGEGHACWQRSTLTGFRRYDREGACRTVDVHVRDSHGCCLHVGVPIDGLDELEVHGRNLLMVIAIVDRDLVHRQERVETRLSEI